MDIKEDKTSSVSLNDENDEYEEIEFASEEELIAEVKRMRRELWELSLNHSRSISDRESDELFSELQKLQKENKENNSKEARFHRYTKTFTIVEAIVAAFSMVVSLILLFVFRLDEYDLQNGYIEMLGITPFVIASVLALGIIAFLLSKKKNYKVISSLSLIGALIALFAFFFAVFGWGKFVFYRQAVITMTTVGAVFPFPVVTFVLSKIAHKASLNKKGK